MARRVRLDAPLVVHHVMVRGLDGARIFLDVDDYQDFVDRLVRLLPACSSRCLAWALMPNHAHLVIQTDDGDLSRLMRRSTSDGATSSRTVFDRGSWTGMSTSSA